jgi:hypothetical protein
LLLAGIPGDDGLMSQLPTPVPSGGRRLERSTVEAWIATLIGVIASAVPMTWWLEALLLVIAALLIGDLALHSPWTANQPRWQRHVSLALGLALIAAVGAPSTMARFNEARHPKDIVTKADLAAAVRQPPRVIVTQITPLGPTSKDDLRFSVTYSNQGQAVISGPIPHFGVGTGKGPVDSAAVDKMFGGFDSMPAASQANVDMVQPGEGRLSTFPSQLDQHTGVTKSILKELQDNRGALYLLVDIRYRDVRDASLWKTQLCQYWDFNVPREILPRIAPHMCTGHNGVFKVNQPNATR